MANSEIDQLIAKIDGALSDFSGTSIASTQLICDHLLDIRLDVVAIGLHMEQATPVG